MSDHNKPPALNSTSFRNKAITFTFMDCDDTGLSVDFPFYDKEVEYSGKVSRRLGYKIQEVYWLRENGDKETTDQETMFVTELCHNLIQLIECKKGDKVTLLFKSGKTQDGKNYSVWLLDKGEPIYNQMGEITNLKSEKEWVKLGKTPKSPAPKKPVEKKEHLDFNDDSWKPLAIKDDPVEEQEEILKTGNDSVETQIKELKTQIWNIESKLERIEKSLGKEEKKEEETESLPF